MRAVAVARSVWKRNGHEFLRCAPLSPSIRQRPLSSIAKPSAKKVMGLDPTEDLYTATPTEDTKATSSDAAPVPAEAEFLTADTPAYIRQQDERRQRLKVVEAEVAAGRRPPEFSGSGEVPIWIKVIAGTGAFCGIAYWVYGWSQRADSGEMKRFLDEKELEEGVIKRPSGLLYKVLNAGDGTHHPKLNSPCLCHYRGSLIDGTEFDSSHERGQPTNFTPEQVIKGWSEALKLMVEGDKWQLYVPARLAYGDSGHGDAIRGGSALVFELELVKVLGGRIEKRKEDDLSEGRAREIIPEDVTGFGRNN